jgi:hypothetical protein
MLRVLQDLDKALGDFPEGKRLCSAHVDPNPLLLFAQEVERGIQFCRQSMSYYEKPNPELYWEEPEKRDPDNPERILRPGKRTRPWEQHTYDFWMARRDRLVRLMVAHHAELFVEYEDSAAMRNDQVLRKKYRPLDSVYILQCHVLLAAMASPGAPKYHIKVQQSAYIQAHKLLQFPREPSSYSAQKQLCTLKWLCSCWKELTLHPELELFLLQLEVRSAQLMLYSGSCLVHDMEDYRRPAGNRLWAPNDLLMSTLACISVGLHEEFFKCQLLPASDRGRWPVGEGMVEAMRQWFLQRAVKMSVRSSSPWIRDNLLICNLWPAERDLFQLENPKEGSPTAMQILRKHREDPSTQTDAADAYVIKGRRGVQYADIIRLGNMSPADALLQHLSDGKWRPGQTEPLVLQLAMVEVFTQEMDKRSKGDFARFCTLEHDFALQLTAMQKEPQVGFSVMEHD